MLTEPVMDANQAEMPVPDAIAKHLDDLGIDYTLSNTTLSDTHPPRDKTAQMILLDDGNTRLQVIIPSNCLLDLQHLNAQQGGSLRAIKPEAYQRLLQQHGVEVMPALPGLTGYKTLVDHRLLGLKEVYLCSGYRETYLKISQTAFNRTVTPFSEGEFSVATAPLLATINQTAGTLTTCFTNKRIQKRLEETDEIPPMPGTAEKIIQLRINPDASSEDLARIIELDPSLAAQVVSWAASPYYRAPGKIDSVKDAIIRVLGFDLVMNLALGLSIGKALRVPADGPETILHYWEKALYCALTMEALAKQMPDADRSYIGMAYLCGLLHNFGYLLLGQLFPPQFSLVNQHLQCNPHISQALVERHTLGATSAQIGGWLMQAWDMPAQTAIALRWQVSSAYIDPQHSHANLLYIALGLLGEQGIGANCHPPADPDLYQHMGLDPARAKEAVERVMAQSEAVLQMAYTII